MKRLLLLALGLALTIVAAHVQFQPPGHARIIRSKKSLRAGTGHLAWAPRYRGTSCLVPLGRDRSFRYERELLLSVDGERVPADVRFHYVIPRQIPPDLPAGEWCEILSSLTQRAADQWIAQADREQLLSSPRESFRLAESALKRSLSTRGIETIDVSVRLRLTDEIIATQAVPEVVARAEKRGPVIFLGLDGADWQLLDRYIDAGWMPNLALLRASGIHGVLETEHPPLSPLLWNTMMTGVGPLQHGVLDFTRFNPVTGVKEPNTSQSRRVPAIWNMATYGGKKASTFGLWATYPAEPVRGLLVSDRSSTFFFNESSPPPGIVYPRSREEWTRRQLAAAEGGVDFKRLREYLPWLTESEYSTAVATKDPFSNLVSALRRVLVETDVYDTMAKEFFREQTPDLTLLYVQGTDSIGHLFAPYAPPRQPAVSEIDFQKYQRVPELYFRRIDRLIGEYRELVKSANGVLMIASDHGFLWSEGRPARSSSFAASTAAKWHRREGVYLLWGQGIPPRPERGPAGGVRQVCATLLDLCGLPPSSDTPSLRGEPGQSGGAVVDYRPFFRPVKEVEGGSPAGTNEELEKLKALGYIGAGESMKAAAGSLSAGDTRTAGSYNNEGLVLQAQKRTEEAIAAYEKAIAVDPNLASALWNLSDLLFARKDLDRSDTFLVRAAANDLPEAVEFVIGRAIGYDRAGRRERSLRLMDQAVGVRPSEPEFRLFRGRYRVQQGNCPGALEDFLEAGRLRPDNPTAHASAGLAAICAGRPAEAERNLRRSLELDPQQPQVREYLRSLGAGNAN